MSKKELSISDLPGVGAATAEKLKEAGFSSLLGIAVATPGELTEAAGIGESAARKIINFARNNLEMGFTSGDELLKKRESVIKISTGSKNFDELIGGGFESGGITECYGAFGSGKCIDKESDVLYFNSSKAHYEKMEDIYVKYKGQFGENKSDDGFIVEVPPVQVWGLKGNKLGKVSAKYLYREKVDKLYEVKTKNGRRLKITGPHKLLSFNKGLQWRPSAILNQGDLVAYPKKLECEEECNLNNDDAYFLGLFAAKGCRNTSRIVTSSNVLKKWVETYTKSKFGFMPVTTVDKSSGALMLNFKDMSKEILGDLTGSNDTTQIVPSTLFQAPKKVVASFLAGYIDGDRDTDEKDFEVTIKSKNLAQSLSYLFLRLGIAVRMKEKLIDNNLFWKLSITNEDTKKLNDLPEKIKKDNYKCSNVSYTYGKEIIDFLRESYNETFGENSDKFRKEIFSNDLKRTAYDYLTDLSFSTKKMDEKTLAEIHSIFFDGKEEVENALILAKELEKLDKGSFFKLHEMLPFSFNEFSDELKGSNFTNDMLLEFSKKNEDVLKKIKPLLIQKLEKINGKLKQVLGTIKNVIYFNWDTIESITKIDYNDYVYDFVVPEGHSFVGGNMPTMLHNTALAHALAVNTQLAKKDGGVDGVVVWVDTENTFRPERIKQIAENRGLDPIEVLKKIRVVRAFNSDHQMFVTEKIENLVEKEKLPVKLVIIDSLMAHFRSEFVGRGTLANRQQKLNKHMHVLMKLADVHNLCVYITNQVMAKPDVFFGDPTAAIGGNIVAHNSTTRLYLRRGKAGTRVAKLVDSPHLPDGAAIWKITDEGIVDA